LTKLILTYTGLTGTFENKWEKFFLVFLKKWQKELATDPAPRGAPGAPVKNDKNEEQKFARPSKRAHDDPETPERLDRPAHASSV
jgi:hypothetical protein